MSGQSVPSTPASLPDSSDPARIKRILEAVLLTSQDPLPLSELRKLFEGELSIAVLRRLLEELRKDWEGKGVELVNVASGWRFHAKPEMQKYLARLNPQKPPRYSRAVLETLAIIAYRQPVTRGDIEEIRGVAVSAPVLKVLESRGWITAVGYRDVPGRPALYATTSGFLSDLNLCSLEELPPLEELGSLLEPEGTTEAISASASAVSSGTTTPLSLLQGSRTAMEAEQKQPSNMMRMAPQSPKRRSNS